MANTFKIGDRVKTITPTGIPPRLNGRVRYIACGLATAKGGKTCDKKTCTHMVKEFVWVMWPGSLTAFSYNYTELEYDAAQPIVPLPVVAINDTEAQDKTTDDKDKSAYLEKAKAAIKDIIKPTAPAQHDFFRIYNGIDQIKYDRHGKPFIREIEIRTGPPIKDDELDYDVYSGHKKGSVRKIRKKPSEML